MEWEYSARSLSTKDGSDPSTLSSTTHLSHINFQRFCIRLLSGTKERRFRSQWLLSYGGWWSHIAFSFLNER
ncbi:hypothetical protein Hdeb2414_s0001g00010891 [Helianthus debilis subsp. tardiflorus]